MMNRQYNEEEANEILRRSISRQAEQGDFASETAEPRRMTTGISSEQLIKMAAELGVTPEAVQAAEQEWRLTHAREQERREFIAHRKQEWTEHLVTYAIVNAFLLLLNFWTEHCISWAVWALFGWGIGIAFHTFSTFRTSGEEFEAEFKKWRKKRKKRRAGEDSADESS